MIGEALCERHCSLFECCDNPHNSEFRESCTMYSRIISYVMKDPVKLKLSYNELQYIYNLIFEDRQTHADHHISLDCYLTLKSKIRSKLEKYQEGVHER